MFNILNLMFFVISLTARAPWQRPTRVHRRRQPPAPRIATARQCPGRTGAARQKCRVVVALLCPDYMWLRAKGLKACLAGRPGRRWGHPSCYYAIRSGTENTALLAHVLT